MSVAHITFIFVPVCLFVVVYHLLPLLSYIYVFFCLFSSVCFLLSVCQSCCLSWEYVYSQGCSTQSLLFFIRSVVCAQLYSIFHLPSSFSLFVLQSRSVYRASYDCKCSKKLVVQSAVGRFTSIYWAFEYFFSVQPSFFSVAKLFITRSVRLVKNGLF